MEKEREDSIKNLVNQELQNNHFAGVLIAMYQKGEESFFGSYGYADLEKKLLLKRNSIFRLYSMSKTVTAVAIMILVERKEISLDDLVSKYLPEYNKLKVYGRKGEYEITIRQLMNMTAGIVYPGEFGAEKEMEYLFERIHKNIQEGCQLSTREVIREIAKVPLANVPGAAWHYGLCADVLGAIIQVVTGMELEVFYREEIFEPLEMIDTGFYVPFEKQNRLVKRYKQEQTDKGTILQEDGELVFGLTDYLNKPAFQSAGAGLVSTLEDMAHFCCMLANQGVWHKKRILKTETVQLFTQNQMTKEQLDSMYYVHLQGAYGYGNLMRVLIDVNKAESIGTVGEFGWDGWAGPYMSVDIKMQRTVLLMTQVSCYYNWHFNNKVRDILLK